MFIEYQTDQYNLHCPKHPTIGPGNDCVTLTTELEVFFVRLIMYVVSLRKISFDVSSIGAMLHSMNILTYE